MRSSKLAAPLALAAPWIATLLVIACAPAWARAEAKAAASAEAEKGDGAHAAGAAGQAGHGTAEHGAAGHGGSSGPNPLAIDKDLAVWTFIVFIGLLVVLGKFAWGPIAAALDLREKNIEDQIAAAQSANDEAKRMLAEYEAKLSKAAEDVRGILDEARRDAEHTQQEILAKARADAGAEMERAKREIGTAKDQAIKELAETSANLAVDLAGRIVRSKLSVQDHARLIEDAMANFPKGDHRGN